MCLNQTSESKVMALWISRDLPLFIVERPEISWALYIHPSQKLCPFDFAKSFGVQFRASQYIMLLNQTSKWKVMSIWISRELQVFIVKHPDISRAYTYTQVKSYGCLNLSTASVFNFECLNILCALIGHPRENLRAFEFLESFHC